MDSHKFSGRVMERKLENIERISLDKWSKNRLESESENCYNFVRSCFTKKTLLPEDPSLVFQK